MPGLESKLEAGVCAVPGVVLSAQQHPDVSCHEVNESIGCFFKVKKDVVEEVP